jgi:AcrR family transcriptional regulator
MTQSKRAAVPDQDGRPATPIRERILGAAFSAFTENGYAGTSTLDIASRAKISKRDLYANFAGKQAVLMALIASRATRMRLPADLRAPSNREMLAATLTAFGATVLREVCQPAVTAMFRFAIAEAEHSPNVARTLEEARSINRDALADLLSDAQKADLLGDADPQLMTEQFFALLWGDLLVARLLGMAGVPRPADIEKRARTGATAFLKLHANSTIVGS